MIFKEELYKTYEQSGIEITLSRLNGKIEGITFRSDMQKLNAECFRLPAQKIQWLKDILSENNL